jgi:hypothetical protein
MVQRQIVVRRPQRSLIPVRKFALLILLPPALIGGMCLLLGNSLVPFFAALGVSAIGLALVTGVAGKPLSAVPAIAQRGRRSEARPNH